MNKRNKQQIISFWDIEVNTKNNKYFLKNKTKIGELYYGIPIYPDYDFSVIKDCILESLFQYPDKIKLVDKLELDKTYYLIEENPWNIVGVISLHKGYTFIDCADHDDRVIIKTAFPNKICNIVGE